MMRLYSRTLAVTIGTVASALLLAARPGAAQTVSWTAWSSDSSTGAIGTLLVGVTPVNVTYTGDILTGQTQLDGGFNHWLPTSTFTGAANVNAPSNGNLIALSGGTATVDTITFSQAITNPLVALWSVGSPGGPITYNFSDPYVIVAGGANAEFGGSSIFPVTATIVGGQEGNGVLVFPGTFTTLTFTVPTAEFFHGFTVGVTNLAPPSAAPEPGDCALLATGLLPLAGIAARRRRRA